MHRRPKLIFSFHTNDLFALGLDNAQQNPAVIEPHHQAILATIVQYIKFFCHPSCNPFVGRKHPLPVKDQAQFHSCAEI
jgi:hypothetical protein